MIARYSRPEMAAVWTQSNRFAQMLKVEQAVAEAQASLNLIPAQAAIDIRKNAAFSVERIDELEKTTKHDVIAFVSNVAENVGVNGRFVHFGLTSSDVLDTATSLLAVAAGEILHASIGRLATSLRRLVNEHADTISPGRTHGMHAEPTTFGLKMAGFLAETERNLARVNRAIEQMSICKLSGAVGTYSTQTEDVEQRVAAALELKQELFATQVIPRDRHAELFSALAIFGAGVERLAVELRHLQRTEVGEAVEGFSPGQKGSSAMPHKKNPISAENLTGCARLLRGYASAAMEDIALWHERDISHSAVERVIFPDAFILADYMADRMARVLDGLFVDVDRMRRNLELSQGQLFSSHFLLALVEAGLDRESAYAKAQSLSHRLKPGEQLRDLALVDEDIKKLLKPEVIERVFSGERHVEAIRALLNRRGFALRKTTGGH